MYSADRLKSSGIFPTPGHYIIDSMYSADRLKSSGIFSTTNIVDELFHLPSDESLDNNLNTSKMNNF